MIGSLPVQAYNVSIAIKQNCPTRTQEPAISVVTSIINMGMKAVTLSYTLQSTWL